jgi:hypothetical protein
MGIASKSINDAGGIAAGGREHDGGVAPSVEAVEDAIFLLVFEPVTLAGVGR